MFPTEVDGDTTKSACSHCKKTLTITLVLVPEWDFLDADGEEIL